MRQTFDLSAVETKAFLRYFNAALRDPVVGMIIGNGSGSFQDGHYVIRQATNFQYAGAPMYAMWRIQLTEDGRLEIIENENTVDDRGQYDIQLHRFINDILQRTLSSRTAKFFRRVHLFANSSCNLPGEYWLPGFRFAPMIPEDDARIIDAERIVVIDQEVDAIDGSHANEVAQEQAERFAAYLSFILDTGLRAPRLEERYVLIQDQADLRMERKSSQIVDRSVPTSMPKKGQLCNLGQFSNSVFDKHRFLGEYLVCPIETRLIIRGADGLNTGEHAAFTRCCRLYRLAHTIGRYYPTVRTAYECASIDALLRTGVMSSVTFKEFMSKHDRGDGELYDLMYGQIRSAHFHAGEFPMGELEYGHDFISGPDSMITFNILMAAHQAVRNAVLAWLGERVDLKKETPDT